MKIIRPAIAGTLESSDAMVRVLPSAVRTIEIESVVMAQYGDEIRRAVEEMLQYMGVNEGEIYVSDRGAIDCVLRARMEAALYRAANEEEG